ncbi:YheU family protein [Endozoicomonas sp. 8E]|uniref:YheU family protein n=1 Tax=Endozoicomonas sp. 8E TaxID=3035692 RepID=UPI002939332B|nr:YheU family protein [Endozoicomonas sp. 8E]WOG29701.1 YheU family protein [Endozoicomonas sp. 8E]
MIIPYQELNTETLNNLIADFVSREGTDNGFEQDQESRIQQVLGLLKSGEVSIVFDPETESVNIIPAKEAQNYESIIDQT